MVAKFQMAKTITHVYEHPYNDGQVFRSIMSVINHAIFYYELMGYSKVFHATEVEEKLYLWCVKVALTINAKHPIIDKNSISCMVPYKYLYT